VCFIVRTFLKVGALERHLSTEKVLLVVVSLGRIRYSRLPVKSASSMLLSPMSLSVAPSLLPCLYVRFPSAKPSTRIHASLLGDLVTCLGLARKRVQTMLGNTYSVTV